MSHPPTTLELALREYRAGDPFRRFFADVPAGCFARVLRYGAPVGSRIEEHEAIPRCMDRLKELIASRDAAQGPLPSGTVVMARELANGCGRFDREWHAPRGGLWLALAWADTLLPEYARLLPLAAGTACCEAVRHFGVAASLKWVNDLHLQGRKVGGILCETFSGGPAGDRYHLIGIGINCNNVFFPEPLRESALSMREALGAPVPLDKFALVLLGCLTWHFGLVHLQEELDLASGKDSADPPAESLVIEAWRRVSDTPGRRVIYGYDVVRRPLYAAVAEGVDPWGGLRLRLSDGTLLTEYSGEILYQAGEESVG
jgi:BirA family transcriptional regulator, biotin operon repressor / biotin---[acetyl-CoA-carboxylase] ligase